MKNRLTKKAQMSSVGRFGVLQNVKPDHQRLTIQLISGHESKKSLEVYQHREGAFRISH
jgi:hypothetical protein